LVTGGAGFVGSAVVRLLIQKGFQVDVVDSFFKGRRENLPEHPNVTIIDGDLTDSALVRGALQRGPKYVIHLAAHHFIPYCIANPTETIRANVLGTQNLLENLSAAKDLEKLAFASTAAVYAPSEHPSTEEAKVAPIDIYGLSKLMGEQLIELHCRRERLPYALARLFNVIGPRETNPHLVPDIIDQLDGDILQLGNLIPRRDYIYVDDIASGLLRLMAVDVPSGPYNIGSGVAYSTSEVVESISRALGRELQISSVPERQRTGDRPVLQSDCSKLRKYGWSPQFDLVKALAETLRAYGRN
jgi:UDP-glucose 4-epimerase